MECHSSVLLQHQQPVRVGWLPHTACSARIDPELNWFFLTASHTTPGLSVIHAAFPVSPSSQFLLDKLKVHLQVQSLESQWTKPSFLPFFLSLLFSFFSISFFPSFLPPLFLPQVHFISITTGNLAKLGWTGDLSCIERKWSWAESFPEFVTPFLCFMRKKLWALAQLEGSSQP